MTVCGLFWVIEWLGVGRNMVAAIQLVGLVVRIEVLVIIQQVGTGDSKAVIAVVVVVFLRVGSVENMDGLVLFCRDRVATSGSAVGCGGIHHGGPGDSKVGFIIVFLYETVGSESSVVMSEVVVVV
jgi:hypothetical protein